MFIFLSYFTCIEAISGQRMASVGSPGCVFCIVFYTRWGNIRLRGCFCGIDRMHALYCVLNALGRGRPNTTFRNDVLHALQR